MDCSNGLCTHAGLDCECHFPDECPQNRVCPDYRPPGRRTLDPDAATRAGVPLDTPAPVEPCPFAGTAPWARRKPPRRRRTRR